MASPALALRTGAAFATPRGRNTTRPRPSVSGTSRAAGVRAELAKDDVASHDDDVSATKRALLSAVSASRKPGADSGLCKRNILDACAALEKRGAVGGDVPFGDVSGRWSLVYSTNDASSSAALGPLAAVLDDDALQKVSNQLYKAFFAFAPALAGSAETNAKGVANTQIVDLQKGIVDNLVDAQLPWPLGEVRIGVRGEVRALDLQAREVSVIFTEWEVGPVPSERSGEKNQTPSLKLPLPRPQGMLRNTYRRQREKSCTLLARIESGLLVMTW